MRDDFPDPRELQERTARRLQRREEVRRRVRRQRRLAGAAALILAAAAVAGAALSLGGGGGDSAGGAGFHRTAASSRRHWRPHTGPVPILEYHVLGRPRTDVAYPELYVPRAGFSKEMDWLDDQGYEAVTLEQVEDAWYHDGTLPAKPIVISFDDGYRPQYTFAMPELSKHGWSGVLNLKAEGSDLYRSNVEAMLDAGWELASHTIHHSDLTTIEGAALEEEVTRSRQILQREYGVSVRNFCYPAGRFDEAVVAAVEAAGYTGATTEIPGYASRQSPYELARIEVLGSWSVGDLAAALRR
jgi:peptidoglycan/xylan/chitin deacetylase (PgdA/CDA1 family)